MRVKLDLNLHNVSDDGLTSLAQILLYQGDNRGWGPLQFQIIPEMKFRNSKTGLDIFDTKFWERELRHQELFADLRS